MLQRVTAADYVRPVDVGRTCPLIVICERTDGSFVPTVVKFSDCCELKEVHLVREAIASMLAGDLGLPIPEPFLVVVPNEWPSVIGEADRRARVHASSRIAFGSKLVTGGFQIWTTETRLTEGMIDTAGAIFAFDGIIQNPDRKPSNPNCLVRGEEIRIFDHELAFAHGLVLNWQGPWRVGGLAWLTGRDSHIFFTGLKRSGVDLPPL